eukprot:8997009-Heterocapsa_arctica.AAC.1
MPTARHNPGGRHRRDQAAPTNRGTAGKRLIHRRMCAITEAQSASGDSCDADSLQPEGQRGGHTALLTDQGKASDHPSHHWRRAGVRAWNLAEGSREPKAQAADIPARLTGA